MVLLAKAKSEKARGMEVESTEKSCFTTLFNYVFY